MRRFMLRLLIALLTFALGVAAATLLRSVVAPLDAPLSDAVYLEIDAPPLPPAPPMPLAPSSPCNTDPHLVHPFYVPEGHWHSEVAPPHQQHPAPPDAPASPRTKRR